MLFTCASCLSSTLNCVWNISTSHCLSSSLAGPLTNSTHITSNSSVCATTLHNQTCSSYHSCNSCAVHNECLWNNVLVACVEADKLQTNSECYLNFTHKNFSFLSRHSSSISARDMSSIWLFSAHIVWFMHYNQQLSVVFFSQCVCTQ